MSSSSSSKVPKIKLTKTNVASSSVAVPAITERKNTITDAVIRSAVSLAVGDLIIPTDDDDDDDDEDTHNFNYKNGSAAVGVSSLHPITKSMQVQKEMQNINNGDDSHTSAGITSRTKGFFHHRHVHFRHNEHTHDKKEQHHLHHSKRHHRHHPSSLEMKRQAAAGELVEAELYLQTKFPNSTEEERRRFLVARHGDEIGAEVKLRAYLEWRSLHGLDDAENENADTIDNHEEDDETDWNKAAKLAIQSASSSPAPLSPPSSATDIGSSNSSNGCSSSSSTKTKISSIIPSQTTLPQLVHFDASNLQDLQNHKILQVMPAQLNPTLATSTTYAQAVAFYLNFKLDRSSMERFTVLIDLRAGDGWYNPTPKQCLPFIKIVSSLLADYFPERLEKCILFPLPKAATIIWGVVKLFLDGNVVKKVRVIGGSGDRHGDPPKDLEEFLDVETIEALERNRTMSFC